MAIFLFYIVLLGRLLRRQCHFLVRVIENVTTPGKTNKKTKNISIYYVDYLGKVLSTKGY